MLMNCRREPMANPTLFNIENLVLRARSEFNGYAGTGASSLGVLEYWSIGVLAKRKLTFDLNWSLSLLHYSTTPSLQQTPASWKEYGSPSGGGPKPGPLGPDSLPLVWLDGKIQF
jgi:hypothetical protein